MTRCLYAARRQGATNANPIRQVTTLRPWRAPGGRSYLKRCVTERHLLASPGFRRAQQAHRRRDRLSMAEGGRNAAQVELSAPASFLAQARARLEPRPRSPGGGRNQRDCGRRHRSGRAVRPAFSGSCFATKSRRNCSRLWAPDRCGIDDQRRSAGLTRVGRRDCALHGAPAARAWAIAAAADQARPVWVFGGLRCSSRSRLRGSLSSRYPDGRLSSGACLDHSPGSCG